MKEMKKSDGQILKTDALGRVYTPKSRQEGLPDEFARSELIGPKFARLAGIKYPTSAAWMLRQRKRTGNGLSCSTAPNEQATPKNYWAFLDQRLEKTSIGGQTAEDRLTMAGKRRKNQAKLGSFLPK